MCSVSRIPPQAIISTVSQRNIGEVYAEQGTIRLQQVGCSSKGLMWPSTTHPLRDPTLIYGTQCAEFFDFCWGILVVSLICKQSENVAHIHEIQCNVCNWT